MKKRPIVDLHMFTCHTLNAQTQAKQPCSHQAHVYMFYFYCLFLYKEAETIMEARRELLCNANELRWKPLSGPHCRGQTEHNCVASASRCHAERGDCICCHGWAQLEFLQRFLTEKMTEGVRGRGPGQYNSRSIIREREYMNMRRTSVVQRVWRAD